jgi:CheY-like chemotaxis protein
MNDVVETPVGATSELNNILQIIGGTTELLENIWEGRDGSEHYLNMLRTSVSRAANITAELVEKAGGVSGRIVCPVKPRATSAARPRPVKARVLIVDDEPTALDLSDQLLSGAGFDVVTAGSGFNALDLLLRAEAPFDVAVLDLTMPFMDGEETFRKIRAIAPDLPVILTTGFIHKARLKKMFAEGLSGFISKPLSPDDMREEIERVLQAREEATADSEFDRQAGA